MVSNRGLVIKTLAVIKMEAEILSTLNEIKTAIYALLAVVILGVVANWIRAGISIKNVIRSQLDDIFSEEAGNFYDEGKFDELLIHCEDKLKEKPNHNYALWYKAKALYRKQEYQKAKEYFEKLASSEPSWSESHINPFLEKIEANLDDNR